MKKSSKKPFVVLAIAGIFTLLAGFGATLAIYTSSVTGTDSARVAKFAFNLNGAGAATSTQSLSINDLFTYTYNNGKVAGTSNQDVVAPGTSGYIKISLENKGEVAIIPSWTIAETNANNIPIQYQISTSTTPVAANWSTAASLSPTANNIAISGKQEYYLHWRWNPSSTNAADTALGVAGTATVSVKVDCTVSQYVG